MINHIAIVGLGSIGRRHLRLVREFRPGIKITVVRSGEGKTVSEEKIANEIVYTLEDAIKSGIQAAVIATPVVFHLGTVTELIRAGVHFLVEKPLSDSTEGVSKLVEDWKKTKIVGLLGYCLHYDPAAKQFKKMLVNGTIGQIQHIHVECGSYLPDWRPSQDYRLSVSARKELGGGVLLELSHELDYIRWFFGEIESVIAVLKNSGTFGLDVEDGADLILKSVKGLPISVHLDFNTRIARRRCVARCSDGDLTWNAVQKKVCWQPVEKPEEVESFAHNGDEIYRLQLKHFFDCMENNKTPEVSLEDGTEVLRMVEAARESSVKRKTVALK